MNPSQCYTKFQNHFHCMSLICHCLICWCVESMCESRKISLLRFSEWNNPCCCWRWREPFINLQPSTTQLESLQRLWLWICQTNSIQSLLSPLRVQEKQWWKGIWFLHHNEGIQRCPSLCPWQLWSNYFGNLKQYLRILLRK